VTRLSLEPAVVFTAGPVEVTRTVALTWAVMALLVAGAALARRRLRDAPALWQEVLESFLELTEATAREVLPGAPWRAVPVLATLWVFIAAANLAGLVPGLGSPTSDLNTTFAFALVSYSLTHVFGIADQGLRGYLRHYRDPAWILLPFHLIAEVTRTVALAIRLFGNMLSGELVAVILLGVVGLLVPVPFDLLHVVIGLIQAYIFGVLTLVFIAGGMRSPDAEGGPP
jgi:F-type H+-transporting ATPase subunit a